MPISRNFPALIGSVSPITLVAGQQASALHVNPVLPNNPTAGNLVVVVVSAFGNSGPFTVTDSNSNNYTPTSKTLFDAGAFATGVTIGIWYLQNAPANASKNIIISSTTAIWTWVAEFSNVHKTLAFENDATGGDANTGATTVVQPSYTSTNRNDLLIGTVVTYGLTAFTLAPWTMVDVILEGNSMAYFVQATPGLQAVGWDQTAAPGQYGAMIAAFRHA